MAAAAGRDAGSSTAAAVARADAASLVEPFVENARALKTSAVDDVPSSCENSFDLGVDLTACSLVQPDLLRDGTEGEVDRRGAAQGG